MSYRFPPRLKGSVFLIVFTLLSASQLFAKNLHDTVSDDLLGGRMLTEEEVEQDEDGASPSGLILNYSNFSVGLTEWIINRVSRKELRTYLKEALFAPSGKQHTSARLTDSLLPNLSKKYSSQPDDKNSNTVKLQSQNQVRIKNASFNTYASFQGEFSSTPFSQKSEGAQEYVNLVFREHVLYGDASVPVCKDIHVLNLHTP